MCGCVVGLSLGNGSVHLKEQNIVCVGLTMLDILEPCECVKSYFRLISDFIHVPFYLPSLSASNVTLYNNLPVAIKKRHVQ